MSYSMKFEMAEHPWSGAVLIFDDGQAKLYKHRLCPDRPVVVQVEGKSPSPEQIEACRQLWTELYAAMDFRVASFCPALLPHSQTIMAPSKIPA
jgi:hypothetical protein